MVSLNIPLIKAPWPLGEVIKKGIDINTGKEFGSRLKLGGEKYV